MFRVDGDRIKTGRLSEGRIRKTRVSKGTIEKSWQGFFMNSDRKQKLIELGSETLAEVLLNLAVHFDEADDLIDRLISTPKENVQRFKKKPRLERVQSSRSF